MPDLSLLRTRGAWGLGSLAPTFPGLLVAPWDVVGAFLRTGHGRGWSSLGPREMAKPPASGWRQCKGLEKCCCMTWRKDKGGLSSGATYFIPSPPATGNTSTAVCPSSLCGKALRAPFQDSMSCPPPTVQTNPPARSPDVFRTHVSSCAIPGEKLSCEMCNLVPWQWVFISALFVLLLGFLLCLKEMAS